MKRVFLAALAALTVAVGTVSAGPFGFFPRGKCPCTPVPATAAPCQSQAWGQGQATGYAPPPAFRPFGGVFQGGTCNGGNCPQPLFPIFGR